MLLVRLNLRSRSCALIALVGMAGCAAPMTPDFALRDSSEAKQVAAAPASYPAPAGDQFPGPNTTAQPAALASDAGAASPTQVAGDLPAEGTIATVRASDSAPTVEQAKALSTAIAELEASGAIDRATQAQLLDGLKSTDPALWPQLLTYFRTAAEKQRSVVAPVDEIKPASAVEPPKVVPIEKPENETKALSDEADVKKSSKLAGESTEKELRNRKRTKAGKGNATTASASKGSTERKVTRKPKSEKPPADWRDQLNASIAKLEKQTQEAPDDTAEIGQHVALRMLYLAAGRRDDALKPIAGIPAAQQDFWSKEIFGLAAYLDQTRNPDNSRRAAEANHHLREATARLGEIATLQVRNLTFCSEVSSYGVFKPFAATEFQAGQELLLYAEVENFKTEHAERGYHTALKASYQILDERGARVEEKEFALTEEYCQNPRRDFFVRYFIWLPQKIYGGRYTLQFAIEDTLSQKIGQASQEFTIKSK